VTYATARLHEEIAYLAFHLHWRLDDVLDFEHHDRRRFVAETAALVEQVERNR
jgi:hypothetical protein